MSSDESYTSFLEKANQDIGDNGAQETSASQNEQKGDSGFSATKAVDDDTEVPTVLKKLDAFYMSETDEPFEAVALKLEDEKKKKDLSADSFGKLIDHRGEVEEVDLKDWNIKGAYDEVVEAVKEVAGKGEGVRVFRVGHGRSRCEYYVVTVGEKGELLGVKARAVET